MTFMRPPVKHAIKVAVSHVLYYTGLLQLMQAVLMRRRAVVLTYHRVLTSEERHRTASHPAIVVDQETFASHMALLERRFRILSLTEFADCLEGKVPFPDCSCVITFDDGWRDNFTNALPILQRHGFPALVFLPVNYIGRGRLFWPEALTHLLSRAVEEVRRKPAHRAQFEILLSGAALAPVLDLTDEDPLPAIIEAVRTQKGRGRPAMEALVAALASELGVSVDEMGTDTQDGFMSWAEVEAMSRRGIAFGGHGVEHHLLTQVSAEEAQTEIRGSRQVIDQRLDERVLAFSYPNGYWSPEIRDQVKAAGYRLSFVTGRGFVSSADDPFTVRRLNVHEAVTSSKPMFLARVVGLL